MRIPNQTIHKEEGLTSTQKGMADVQMFYHGLTQARVDQIQQEAVIPRLCYLDWWLRGLLSNTYFDNQPVLQ